MSLTHLLYLSGQIALALSIALASLFGLTEGAAAQAKLRSSIEVEGPLVTLGDLFDNAGDVSRTPVFRAPSIGQSGTIRAERVLAAAQKAGLMHIDRNNIHIVNVTHASQVVTESDVSQALLTHLRQRGYVANKGTIQINLSTSLPDQHAPLQTVRPVEINRVNFDRATGRFTAIMRIGGRRDLRPIRLTGSAIESRLVPVITRNLQRGEIVGSEDIVMQALPVTQARFSKPATLADIIGKAARQQIRAGSIANANQFQMPHIVNRSDLVTILFKAGSLTLTIKGKAMSAGARGDTIAVQNTQTSRIVRGTVKGPGLIQVGGAPKTIASLGVKKQ